MILRENEYMYTVPEDQNSTIHSYESNQLASNKPCEDSRTEGSFLHKKGKDFTFFDLILCLKIQSPLYLR